MSTEEIDPSLEALLQYLRSVRGFDFTHYKRGSLIRRIRKQMQQVGVDTYEAYVDYLEVQPEEFIRLFNTILINVTAFYRDPPAWGHLSTEIIPRILAQKAATEPIRVWSAGCASGEEAYTLAVVLAEAMGTDLFRARVKIYATDIDEEALARARQSTHTAKDVSGLPPVLLGKYFEESDGKFTFRKDLRRCVIFGRNDLMQDAPISRVDLLVCRNTLMYFNSEAQNKIVSRFHFALNDFGYLMLGRAEMLLSHSSAFAAVDVKRRIFYKVPKNNFQDRLLSLAQNNGDYTVPQMGHARIQELAYDAVPVAQIVVDAQGFVVAINEGARTAFGLSIRDLGRPLQDLEISYRPVELRNGMEQAYQERKPVCLQQVTWMVPNGGKRCLDITVAPLINADNESLGIAFTFNDVTAYSDLRDELEHSSQELETAYEELQSTNEELETTNEELQSTVEELETTNEELQSTNEELETMNEELQSTNLELQTLNDVLRDRSDDLNQVNAFMESIFVSLRGGVVVLDRDCFVQIWNPRAEELWGLRSDEVVGRPFLKLDIGLPVAELKHTLTDCVAGGSPSQKICLNAVNRRGKPIRCNITCTPLLGAGVEVRGAILLMDDQPLVPVAGSSL